MRQALRPWRELTLLLTGLHKELLATGALSMAIHLLMLAPSLYMLQVYDRVMISHNELTLLLSTLMLVLLLSLVAWFEHLRTGVLVDLGIALDQRLQPKVFHASLRRELQAPAAHTTQLLQDLAHLRQFITSQGIFAFFDAPWFCIYAGVLFLIHPLLGWTGLAFALVHLGFIEHSRQKAAPLIEQASALQLAAQGLEHSHRRNAETLQAMGMLPALQRQWALLYDRWNRAQTRAQDDGLRRASFSKWLRYTQQSLSLAAGALLVLQGEISAGAMIATNILMTRMLQPLDSLTSSWRSWLGTHAALRRLHEQIADEPAALKGTSDWPGDPGPVRVRAEALSASVPDSQIRLLDNIDLDLLPGHAVALLGPSGAGKTTLALALMGGLPGCSGHVFWNDQPVAYPSAPPRHARVGYLPQQIEFVTGTVAQNIARFGKVQASAVIEAAMQAGVHEMVLRLPQGYDTRIGPQGLALSSGQKQRIGLARALLGQPRFLVLDEPDAHLDNAGELALVSALQQLKARGCTLLLITHRQRLLSCCDRRLRMQAGRIVQELSPLPEG